MHSNELLRHCVYSCVVFSLFLKIVVPVNNFPFFRLTILD